jgi:hypothetical protein
MTTFARRATVVPAALLALALAACSTPYGSSSASPPAPTTTAIVGAATPALTKASDLRASITYLLVEHAFLLAATTAPSGAPADSPAALDANSHDLANLLAEGYGAAFGTQFYAMWSARIADLVAYAKAGVAKDTAAQTQAKTTLATDDNALATYLHTINQFVAVHTVTNPATGIGDEFTSDDTAFMALIDAQASNDPTTDTKLVTAAENMPHTAEILAAAEAKLYPAVYTGTPTASAADLRSSFTELMVEHIYLAAITYGTVAAGQAAGPAGVALDANSTELHNGISSMFNDTVAGQFTALWSAQTEAYEAYAAATTPAAKSVAASQLDTFVQNFGRFIFLTTDSKMSADAASSAIGTQVGAVKAVIDAEAAGGANVAALTRAAAGAVPNWVATFTEAVAELQPLRYLP